MGLLQAAYRTYEAQAGRAGVLEAGQKEALTPVSHMLQNAQLEITLPMMEFSKVPVRFPRRTLKPSYQ